MNARRRGAKRGGMDPCGDPSPVVVAGTRLTLIEDGPARLRALLTLITGARRSLRVLYYIFADDDAGRAVRDALVAAAARGIVVSVVVDGFGSEPAARENFFAPLKAEGAAVCSFEPRWGRRYLLRNHQKLLLADGEDEGAARAIIGGFNVQDAYFGEEADNAWRDLGLLIEGPVAARITGYFEALARWTADPRASFREMRRLLDHPRENDGPARWLLGGPSRRLSPWARQLRAALRVATRIDIISAYFAPNPAMLRRLDRASRRHRRVRLVTPAKMEHQGAIAAARFTYAGLLRKGVRIWEYQPTKMHTKLFVIDDAVFIGSANFDMRSLFLNMEIMLHVEDAGFAALMRGYVDREIARSEEITAAVYRERTGWRQRLRQLGAYLLIAVVDPSVTRGLNFGVR